MPAIVSVKKADVNFWPNVLSELKPLCNSVTQTSDSIVLEPKSGYLTPLSLVISRRNISYEIIFADAESRLEKSSALMSEVE